MKSTNIKIALAAILFCCNSLYSVTSLWTWEGGTDSDWFEKSNWITTDGDASVGSTDTVVINAGASRYPVLLANATMRRFIMNEGWMFTNGYTLTTLEDITVYSGQFYANASTITATDIYLNGGTMYINGNKITISDDVVIDGGLLKVVSNNASIPDDLFILSGKLDLTGNDLLVGDEYTYVSSAAIINPGKIEINNLLVDFNGADTLVYKIYILESGTFVEGIIKTSLTDMLIFDPNATAAGMSNASHVNGPVRKLFGTSGNVTFGFPVGNGSVFATLIISDFQQARSQDYFTARYYNSNAPYNHSSKDTTLDHVGTAEYWTLERDASSGTATTDAFVNLSYNENTRSGEIDNPGHLRIARWDGTKWKNEGRSNATGNTSVGALRTTSRQTVFGTFTLASSTTLNPLPISLLDFSATPGDKLVDIRWTTSEENINADFIIEKSIDGKTWASIAVVEGTENSTQFSNYLFVDRMPVSGTQFYRLVEKYLNAQNVISQIRQVNFITEAGASLLVFPNPAIDVTTIHLDTAAEGASIRVYNSLGIMVIEMNNQSGTAFDIDMSYLQRDVYTVTIVQEAGISTSRILKN